jgi:hypothetical protein
MESSLVMMRREDAQIKYDLKENGANPKGETMRPNAAWEEACARRGRQRGD